MRGERSYDYSGAQRLAGFIEGVYRYNALLFLSMGHPQGAKEQYEKAITFYAEMRKEFGGYYPFEFQLQIVDIYKEMGQRFESREFYQNAVNALEDLLIKERRETIFNDPRNFVSMETAVIFNQERLKKIKEQIEKQIDSLEASNSSPLNNDIQLSPFLLSEKLSGLEKDISNLAQDNKKQLRV